MSFNSRKLLFGSPNFSDPYWNNVSLLLHGDGIGATPNGQQNNTFIDSSSNNFTITRNGTPTQGSFSPYNDNWSNYFNGSGSRLRISSNTNLNILSGDFTIEFFVNVVQMPPEFSVIIGQWQQNIGFGGYTFGVQSNGQLFFSFGAYSEAVNLISTTTNSLTVGKYSHVAITRNASNFKVFIDGLIVGSAVYSGTKGDIGIDTTIGNYLNPTNNFPAANGTDLNAYVSNLRIVKGTALYISSFTPPTSNLTAVAGTSLLTCQSNRLVDNSSNNFTITASGTPSVTLESPFKSTSVYSPTLNGGSSYFSSGNSDKLTLPSTAVGSALDYGTGNFTIECWYNFIQIGPNNLGFIISQTVSGNNNLLFAIDSSRAINIWLGSINLGTSAVNSIPLNTWCHVALVRNGTSVKVYVNGVSVLSVTSSASIGGGMLPCINGYGHAAGYGNICYISNMRIVKGLAIYTSNFTPPTSPLTLTSNGGATPSTAPTSSQVSLLCDFTNGGIFDNTKKNVLTTVGDAKVSSSQIKFGSGSLAFDGNGDYLTTPINSNFNFTSGKLTIEFWLRANYVLSGVYQTIIGNYNSTTTGWLIQYDNKLYINLSGDVFDISGTTILQPNVWNHVALSGSSGSYKLFLNGVQEGATYTGATVLSGGILGIGAITRSGFLGANPLSGYLDELRITNEVRYTTNFTPPIRAFPNK